MTLVPLPFCPPLPEPVEMPRSPQRRRTIRQRLLIGAGVHPATRRPTIEGTECRGCSHLVLVDHHGRRYWKCDRHTLGITHGPATDVRLSWPGCTLREEAPDADAGSH